MRPRIAALPLAVLLVLVASFGAVDAHQPVNIPRVGFFRPAPPSPELARILESFKQGLREQGFVDGQSVAVEVRFPATTADQLSGIAAELVRLKPDAIFAAASSGIDAVRSATTTIPIVALDLETDPLASGIVASLARPGGNVTGIFLDFPELGGKWLELVTEVAPKVSRVGTDLIELYRQGGVMVGKILKGASPRSLPIERPNRFALVVNMKTARTLGITIPRSVLIRADRVIE
jgi:ABC-type uncharacterized transport system substrate-binding protein